ncbi:hypothetical protein [Kocuria coralli]|uniref:hypothetical protein n=1 Tax=Kocuria coralli TaxID=1461025 RepID=UPI0015F2BF9C|nr:hypothetical protein [Kocuria coralli]
MSSAPSRPPSPPSAPPQGSGGSHDVEPSDGPAEPKGARRPMGRALLALIAAGAAMLMTSGPLWLTVAGMVAGLAALVFAISAVIHLRKAQRRGLILFSALIAVTVAGFALVSGGVRLAFWDTVSAYETCAAQSVTISGEAACREQMEDGLRGVILPGLN